MNIPFSKVEKYLLALLGVLLVASFFVNIGEEPLYLEEPRRAMVAAEMDFQDNLIVPTHLGEFYYRKPPLFNWVILASLKTFPAHPEFACRLISILSFLTMGLLTWFMGRTYYSERLGVYSALLLLTTTHYYFYASLFAEIDLFYSVLTYASILCLYHFYKQDRKWLFFLCIYGLNALGTITKGAPSPVFLVTSLGVFLLFFKRLKWLFSLQHLSGMLLFAGIVGGYFYAYSQFNPLENYFNGLYSQASERTAGENPIELTLAHMGKFPLITLLDLLPASLFLLLIFRKGAAKTLWANEFLRFVLLMFAANIFIYWISPGTRSRYLYMLYPLPIVLFTWLYCEYGEGKKWMEGLLKWVTLILLILVAGAMVAVPFIPQLATLPGRLGIAIGFGVGVLGLIAVFFLLQRKGLQHYLLWLVLLLVVGRLGFDLFALPVKATAGEHFGYREHGEKVAEITKGSRLWLYNYHKSDEAAIKFGHVFYMEWGREEVLHITWEKNCTDFFLTQDHQVKNDSVTVFYEFDYRWNHFQLVKFHDCP